MKDEFQAIETIDFKKPTKKPPKIDNSKMQAQEQQKKVAEIAKTNENRYKQLLQKIVDTLTKNNPDLAEDTKIILKPPKVEKIGTKKTAIINFVSLCKQLDRHPDHVKNFFSNDLGKIEGSIGNNGLVMKTILTTTNVQNLFKKYIGEYVQCRVCRRQNTELIKDEKMRLWKLLCHSCKSDRTVPTIKGAQKRYQDYEAEQQNEKNEAPVKKHTTNE